MNGALTVGGTAAGAYVGTPYFPVSEAVMRILPESEVEVEVVFEVVDEVVEVFEEDDVVELFSSSVLVVFSSLVVDALSVVLGLDSDVVAACELG
jgi:hypothetical protein